MFIFSDKGTAIPITAVRAVLPAGSGSIIELENGTRIPTKRKVKEVIEGMTSSDTVLLESLFKMIDNRFKELDIPNIKQKIESIDAVVSAHNELKDQLAKSNKRLAGEFAAGIERLTKIKRDVVDTTTYIKDKVASLESAVEGMGVLVNESLQEMEAKDS